MIKTLINHWRVLHLPIISVGFIVIMMGLLIGFANHYKSSQYTLLKSAKATYQNTQNTLQLAKQEQQDIQQYLPKYQYLFKSGFIGEERRNQWIARLHQVANQYQLLTIDYEIAPQTVYQPKLIVNLGNYQMHRSVMTMKWGLLHEQDFIHVLTDLRVDTSPFMVRDCEITLVSDRLINTRKTISTEQNSQSVRPNLAANCAIDWITIQAPSLKAEF